MKNCVLNAIKEEGKKMDNYIQIEGKKIKLSEETIKEIKDKFINKDALIIPANMAEYGCRTVNLRSPTDNKQYMYYSSCDCGVRVDFCDYWDNEATCKLEECKFEDLKVGDVFIYDTSNIVSLLHKKLNTIIETNDNLICFQYWDTDGYITYSAINDNWSYYYKVVPLEKDDEE